MEDNHMDDENEQQAQEYFETPLVSRAMNIFYELLDSDFDELPKPAGNSFRDAVTKAYYDAILVEQGRFPEHLSYRFAFLVPEIQAYTKQLIVYVIADNGKEAMKQGLIVGSIFGGQLCSVRVPSNA